MAANSHAVHAVAQHASNSGQRTPPRSFPCSFCGREFRNAQALGGHMNVHRRERNLAKDLMQLRNQGTGEADEPPSNHASNSPPVHAGSQEDVITKTNKFMQGVGDVCAGSSSSSSSPPSQASTVPFASSLGYRVSNPVTSNLPSHGSVDLELRLGHPPDM